MAGPGPWDPVGDGGRPSWDGLKRVMSKYDDGMETLFKCPALKPTWAEHRSVGYQVWLELMG